MQHLYFKYLQNNICDSLGVPYCAVCVLCKGLSYPSVHLHRFIWESKDSSSNTKRESCMFSMLCSYSDMWMRVFLVTYVALL